MSPTAKDSRSRPTLSRRQFGASLAALAASPRAIAQASGIELLKLNCFGIRVSDPAASVRFYQTLFGMPVQAEDAGRVCLRIGNGPHFMAIRAVAGDETPAITHLGYSVADYEPGRVLAGLANVGFERIDAPPLTDPGSAHAMKTWVRTRNGTEELYFADAAGLIVQLSDAAYCGGGGPAGTDCGPVESIVPGPFRLSEINHFTVFGTNGAEANRFYQETFGLAVQAFQGPNSPVTGIGDGYQFVMYAGGGGRGGAMQATIHHGSFNMHAFDVERVRAALTEHGLSDRGDAPAGPLMHYISLRMPERGGAEGGTPELYFTDPDGILLQLQDVTYCGGGGYLGSECL